MQKFTKTMRGHKPLALVIGASAEAVYAIGRAQAQGLYVLAFDGDPNAAGLACADESVVTDIRQPENIIRCLNGRRPDIILPVPIGRWLLTAGKINDYFRLGGNGAEICDLCTDKHKFHLALSAKGLRSCEHFLVSGGSAVFPQRYPVVLKPRFGSGSRLVSVINNRKQLTQTLAKMAPLQEDFVVETRVEGTEYGLDAAVVNGRFYPVLLRRKENTPPPACQCTGYYAVSAQNPVYARVCAFMEKLVRALALSTCLLHADLVDSPSGIFVIELSPRPSGHNLHNDFTIAATGVNMVDEYISVVLKGKEPSFTPSAVQDLLISYFTFTNCRVLRLPDERQLARYPLKRYHCRLTAGEELPPFSGGAELMRRGYYILQASGDENLKNLRDQLLQEFEISPK